MACKVCGDRVEFCEQCNKDLDPTNFYCYEQKHFCSQECWESWLIVDCLDEFTQTYEISDEN